jgi:hypothetical protein
MSLGTLDGLLSYVNAHRSESRGHADYHRAAPVVTIAADHGAGGPEVGAQVAERLGVQCFDKTLLNAVIKEAKSDSGLMRRLDDELPPRPGTALYAAFLGIDDPLEEYRRLMVRVLDGIALRGGVILGRGAHRLLHGEPLLRVRLIGSPDVCAWRLADGDPTRLDAKRAEVAQVNADKAAFLRKCFHIDRNDPAQYDLVINTDRFTDLKPAAELILMALNTAGRTPLRGPRPAVMAA